MIIDDSTIQYNIIDDSTIQYNLIDDSTMMHRMDMLLPVAELLPTTICHHMPSKLQICLPPPSQPLRPSD